MNCKVDLKRCNYQGSKCPHRSVSCFCTGVVFVALVVVVAAKIVMGVTGIRIRSTRLTNLKQS